MPDINGQQGGKLPLTLETLVDYAAERMRMFHEERLKTADPHLKVYLLGREDAYQDIMLVWFTEHNIEE